MVIIILILILLALCWTVTGTIIYVDEEVWEMSWSRKARFMILGGPGVWLLSFVRGMMSFFKSLLD